MNIDITLLILALFSYMYCIFLSSHSMGMSWRPSHRREFRLTPYVCHCAPKRRIPHTHNHLCLVSRWTTFSRKSSSGQFFFRWRISDIECSDRTCSRRARKPFVTTTSRIHSRSAGRESTWPSFLRSRTDEIYVGRYFHSSKPLIFHSPPADWCRVQSPKSNEGMGMAASEQWSSASAFQFDSFQCKIKRSSSNAGGLTQARYIWETANLV